MRPALIVSIAVTLVVALVALFAGKDIWAWINVGGPEATVVRMEPASVGVLVETVSAPGIIEPKRKVDVSAEVSARIVELPHREGERVRAGDLIMRLDDRDLKAALQSVEARRDGERYRLEAERSRIVGTQNTLENARATAQRQESLFRAGDISRQAYEDSVTRAADLDAQFQAQKNTIVQLEKSLANAEVGELVVVGTMNNPGTKILTIADLSKMKLTAKVSESDIPRVAKDQPGEVRINGYKKRIFAGTVEEVALSRTNDKDGTGFFKTAVLLDLKGEQIFSGLGGNVDISIARHSGLNVPSQAVIDRKVEDLPDALKSSPLITPGAKNLSMVYRVVDGKAVATPVATGPSNLTNTIIVDGLKEGEVVVVGPYKSLERLKDGDAVKAEESWGGGEGGGSGGGGSGGGRGRGMRMRF